MLKIDIISVQPQMFRGFLEESIVAARWTTSPTAADPEC